jgi:hypothetical protein
VSKALKIVATGAAIVASVALIATGVGAPAGTAILGTTLAAIASTAATVAMVASIAAQLTAKKPKSPNHTTERLHATFDLNAPRKIVYGTTAMATDVRYATFAGANQEYYHQILAVASHKVEGIDEIWFDTELAWSATGGVTAAYAGYLTVDPKLEGSSGNTVAIDGNWNSSSRLTGCAYIYLRYKLTGNSKKAESPFGSQIPSRVTVRGKGAFVPDIRAGGVSASDQSTWVGGASARNPALQLLFYLRGWRINGKLAVGRGIPANRIDLNSFITAANMCDETVALAAGGTEPRYRADGVFSEGDGPSTVLANLTAAMNAELRDSGGKITLHVLHNDLAVPKMALGLDDIVGGELWKQTPEISETFNVVRGRFVDPSNVSLYQPIDYPEVSLASVDGIERTDSFDLLTVQSASQAQRLAKQRLQRNQYQGTYAATFRFRAVQANLGDVITLSHGGLGWENKLFRVVAQTISQDGSVPMVLREEHASIYAWDADESPAVTPGTPTTYDPTKAPWIQALYDVSSLNQMLADDTFISTHWNVPLPAARIEWAGSRNGYAATVPFVASTDFRIFAAGALTMMPRVTQGRALYLRVTADPSGFSSVQVVDDDGAFIIDTDGAFVVDATSADFNLVVALDWLDAAGNYISREVLATLTAAGGKQTIIRSAMPPVTAVYARPSFGYTSQTGKSGGWVVYEPWLNEHEPAADITSGITGIAEITVEADHTGSIIAGQLPRNDAFKLMRGGQDVTTQAAWVREIVSGTYTGTVGAATGVLNSTALGSKEAVVRLTATLPASAPRTFDVKLRRNDAPPPASGGSGGGTGGTAASTSTFSTVSSTSMAAISGELTVTVGSAGQVSLSAPLTTTTSPDDPAESIMQAGIWQWWNGSAWVDQGTETTGDPVQVIFVDGPNYYNVINGSLNVSATKTGLTAATSQKFRLRARNTAGTRTIWFSGTASAQG